MGYYETFEKTKETVAQLKREKRLDEALVLCEQWMKDSIRPNGVVESEPFRQAAVLYRQAKRYADEVAVLERFAGLRNSGSQQSAQLLYDRLPKAYVLAGLAEQRTVDGQTVVYHVGRNCPIDELPIFSKTGLLLDTETTGFGSEDELIEIACILFQVSPVSGRIKVIDEYQGLREPGCPIPAEATKVHGLRMADVKGKRIDEEKVRSMFAQADFVIAHNAPYDRRFVGSQMREFLGATWYCSMNGIGWKNKGFESKGLDSLSARHGIDRSSGHRAMNDARATLALLSMKDANTGEPYWRELMAGSPVGFTSRYERPEPFVRVLRVEAKQEQPGFWARLRGLFG